MTQTANTKVIISHRSKSDLSYLSYLELRVLTKKDKLIRGLISLILSWLAGLLFVFIPILHFVLVPASILTGLFLLYRELNFDTFRIEKKISCPECKSSIILKAKAVRWPMYENCGTCRGQILIESIVQT